MLSPIFALVHLHICYSNHSSVIQRIHQFLPIQLIHIHIPEKYRSSRQEAQQWPCPSTDQSPAISAFWHHFSICTQCKFIFIWISGKPYTKEIRLFQIIQLMICSSTRGFTRLRKCLCPSIHTCIFSERTND